MNLKTVPLAKMLRVIVWLAIFVLPTVALAQDATETLDGGLPRSAAGQILFVREGDIFVINGDGTDERNLTNSEIAETTAFWSPDGSQIAFKRDNQTGSESIYLMSSDGSEEFLIYEESSTDHKISLRGWSPNRQWLLITSFPLRDERIVIADGLMFLLDVETQRRREINSRYIYVYGSVSWSPDSRSMAIGLFPEQMIALLDVDLQDFYYRDSNGFGSAPIWSPDGLHIAFIDYSTATMLDSIHIIDANGENEVSITQSEMPLSAIAWSPDSTKIVYINDDQVYGDSPNTHMGIGIIEIANGNTRAIVEDMTNIGSLDWALSSDMIAFVACECEANDIVHLYTVDADTSEINLLVEDISHDSAPRWRP